MESVSKVISTLAASAVVAAGAWTYGQVQYQAGREDARADQVLAELQAFRAESQRMSALSKELSQAASALRAARPQLIEGYIHAAIASPLPAGCVYDDSRVQHISDAERAARAAIEHGRAVPAAGADRVKRP